MTETRQGDHTGNWYVLLCGLPRPADTLTLTPGISLRPLAEPLTVFDLAAAGAAGFRSWAVLEPLSAACLCEIESARDSDIVPGYDTLGRAWLASALLVLRGFTRQLCVACSAYPWGNIAGHQKRTAHVFKEQSQTEGVHAAVYASKRDLPSFKGDILDFHLKLLVNKGARTDSVSAEDAVWVREHYDIFNRLASESESFRFALEAAIDWRYATDARAAVARLWGGTEALLGVTSELVYRISLLCACLLAPRGDDRKVKFQEVRSLYGLRSKVVHGEPLPEDRIAAALNDSFSLLSSLLLLIISRGRMLSQADFDEAVFS